MAANMRGLPLVKKIAEAHGGRAGASSVPRAGTSFCILIPMQRDEKET